MTEVHRRFHIKGRVQGVGFRQGALEQARELGLRATAQNLASGDVEVHVEGELIDAEVFTEWAHRGPLLAKVTAVSFTDEAPSGLVGLRILT